jgi:hypothetical protein
MLSAKICGGIVLGAVGALPFVADAVPITPVAVVGHPAPGMGGNFDNVYNITINDAGLVSTKATVRNPAYNSALWIGTPTSLQLLVRMGQVAPDTPPETIFNDLEPGLPVPIGSDGQIVFEANIEGPTFPDIMNNGIWGGPAGAPHLIARVGVPAHGVPGATYGYYADFDFFSVASGRIIYPNQLAGGSITEANKYGLWEGPINSPELLFRSPQHAPGTPDGVNFGRFIYTQLNSAGQISFVNLLTGPAVTNDDSVSMWAGPRTDPHLVFRAGLDAPGTPPGVKFANGWTHLPLHLNDQGKVIFYASLSGPGLDDTNDSGIFAGPPAALELIARAGSHAPGTAPGVVFSKTLEQVAAPFLFNFDEIKQNNIGTIAFKGRITGPGITSANDEGLWIGAAGAMKLYVSEGYQAPGMPPGVVFSRIQNGGSILTPFTLLRLTDTDQIAFMTGVTGPGVNSTNQIGLFASDGNGNLGLIARSGDFMDVGNGELRQITQLWPESFNSVNQLSFLAYFTDGTNGAFIATVPEPGALVLLASALFAAHRLARKRRA